MTHKEFEFIASLFTDEPNKPNTAAMTRFRQTFEDLIVRVPNVTGKFRSRVHVKSVAFPSPASELRYKAAWTEFCKKKQKLQQDADYGGGIMLQWQIQRTFEQAAEREKASVLATEAARVIPRKVAIIAVKYRQTAANVVRSLVLHHGIPRNRISMIWGGDPAFDSKKRLTIPDIAACLHSISQGEDIPRWKLHLLERQLAETEEDRTLVDELKALNLNLGVQSMSERQSNIDRFQNNETDVCVFTFASGGIGLSLHHAECNNYGDAIALRQREVFSSLTWSEVELVQALWRGHRSIFSLSDTDQTVYGFGGTIETEILERVLLKLSSQAALLKGGESFNGILDKAAISAAENFAKSVDSALELTAEEEDAAEEDDEADEEEAVNELEPAELAVP